MSKELIALLREPATPAIYGQDVMTMRSAADALEEAERKLAMARDELLRCKEIMLRECGIGLVNEVVLAQIGGDDART